MSVEAVIFDKNVWSPDESEQWLGHHNFKPIKAVHETAQSYRYRIQEPGDFNFFRTILLKGGIKLLLGK